jgi:predicted nucleic acid-binding protein
MFGEQKNMFGEDSGDCRRRVGRCSANKKIMLATARAYGAVLWTQDADFRNVQDVQYVEKK